MKNEMKDRASSLSKKSTSSGSKSVGSKSDLENQSQRKSTKKKSNSVTSTKSADSAKPKPEEKKGGEDMVFLFVARDSDCLIYENHIKKTIQPASFRAMIDEVLSDYTSIDEASERPLT